MARINTIRRLLEKLYGPQDGGHLTGQIERRLDAFQPRIAAKCLAFDAADAILITYADSIGVLADSISVLTDSGGGCANVSGQPRKVPLAALRAFANRYLAGLFSAIHFLPFFPYSSDDGFSVIDFHRVDPAVGNWDLVTDFGHDYVLMLDYVLNHVSAGSPWIKAYLQDHQDFQDLAIALSPETDLSAVTRPRTSPLLTPFQKANGQWVHLWTTFSADQVDLNYHNPAVFLRMVDVLLAYAAHGARVLRLDAVAYLWKTVGTSCIHLPETHLVVRLLRAILQAAAPGAVLITETNVPHAENIRYFGEQGDEAQMVYNFSLPPLLLHTFISGDTRLLSEWVAGLEALPAGNAFFNFTASHDGIGVRPLEGLVEEADLQRLIDVVKSNGGRVSYKNNSDGSRSPYELNITYLDALKDPNLQLDPHHVERFMASQAIALSLPGIPGIYIHSLLGSRNWQAGVLKTGRHRSINREKLDLALIMAELEMAGGFRRQVFQRYRHLLRVRRQQPAFSPDAGVRVMDLGRRVFALERTVAAQQLLVLTNISAEDLKVTLPSDTPGGRTADLLSGEALSSGRVDLRPYQTVWLTSR
jgi:glucosylglycerate phosphorylase